MVGLAELAGTASAAHRWSGEPFAAPTGMDFDGDGHDELIIRRPSFDPSDRTANDALGSVEIYCTQRRELLLLLNSPWPNDLFGFSAGSAGDITGDGFADVVVGAPYALRIDDSREPAAMSVNDADDAARRDGETSNAARGVLSGDESGLSNEAAEGQADAWPHGRVDVFCGATGQLVRSLQHPQMYLLGRVVAGVGDVNGDGVPDIAASGYARDAQHNAHERVIVFCGLTSDAIRVFMPERTGDGFGHTIAGLGDLDGDGFADIAIGAPNAIADPQQNTRGVIHVFRGEPMPDVAEVLLSDEPITQVRRADRHAFARIAASDSLLEFGRHVLAGPMAAMRPDGSVVALDDIVNENEPDAELLRTMLVLSMRFDQSTQKIAWLAETIDPLTGERLSHAELPRFERGGDITRDLAVSERDLEALLTMLGNAPDPNDPFHADLNDDDAVDAHDLDRVTEHFGTRHQLLNLTANAGDAMAIVIEELNAHRRLSIADDQRCAQPMRTRAFPGVAVFCDDDAQWIGANPPGVMPIAQSQEDGGSNPWLDWWNSVCPGCNYGECCTGCCSAPSPPPGCCGGLPAYCDHICGTGGGGGGTGSENPGGGEGGGNPGNCPGDRDCDGIPDEFDCDHPNGPASNDPCCDNGPPPTWPGGPYTPQHPQNDDDDDNGIPNWADCNSDCYVGNAETDCACQDNGHGVLNQLDCVSDCYFEGPERGCDCVAALGSDPNDPARIDIKCLGTPVLICFNGCPEDCEDECEPGDYEWSIPEDLVEVLHGGRPGNPCVILRLKKAEMVNVTVKNGCCRVVKRIAVVDTQLLSFEFAGEVHGIASDLTGELYVQPGDPHWERIPAEQTAVFAEEPDCINDWNDLCEQLRWTLSDEVKSYPAAYTRSPNESIVIKNARFRIAKPASLTDPITLAITTPNGLVLTPPLVSAGNDVYKLNEFAIQSRGNTIAAYDPFTISWQLRYNNKAIECCGPLGNGLFESKNQVYITLNDPAPEITPHFHTTFDLACEGAAGLDDSDPDLIIEGIWAKFATKQIVRAEDGTVLTYYENWQTDVFSSPALIMTGDGQCGSWAQLFRRSLSIHNEHTIATYVFVIPTAALGPPGNAQYGFMINHWSFVGLGSFPMPNYRHLAIPIQAINPTASPFAVDLNGLFTHNWHNSPPPEIVDHGSIMGQGLTMPLNRFNNHQVVEIAGKYYDPGYGTMYLNLQELQAIAIAADWIFGLASETDFGIDVDGDGQISSDTQIPTYLHQPFSIAPGDVIKFSPLSNWPSDQP